MHSPICPLCKSAAHLQRRDDGDYLCTKHKVLIAGDGDDGGDFHTDPSKRLELQDEARKRQLNKIGGRRR